MIIDVEYPFTIYYKSGSVSQGKDGRRHIQLTRYDGSQTGTTYARYLMSVHLGYFIPGGLEVDHIDNDKTNDCVSNYQLLTQEENLQKHHNFCRMNVWEYIDLTCSNCKQEFVITKGEYDSRQQKNHNGNYFCNDKCYHQYISIDANLRQEIILLANENISSIDLGKKLGVSCSTVNRYREIKFLETLPESTVLKIKQMDNSDINTSSIAKELNISFKAAKKYRSNAPQKGAGIKITADVIEKIKSMDNPSITDSHIAKILEIDDSTVAKYRSNRPIKTNPKELIQMIQEVDDGVSSNRAIARILNITKDSVNKYRQRS